MSDNKEIATAYKLGYGSQGLCPFCETSPDYCPNNCIYQMKLPTGMGFMGVVERCGNYSNKEDGYKELKVKVIEK